MTTVSQSSDERRPPVEFVSAAASTACPLCELTTQTYLFMRHGARVVRCANCGLTRLGRRPAPPVSGGERHPGAQPDPAASLTERRAAEAYVDVLQRCGAGRSGMLVIAPAASPFAAIAEREGFATARRLDVRELERVGALGALGGPYDVAVVLLQLEQASNPVAALEYIHRALAPDGVLLIVTPSLDSWPARLLRSQWTEWRDENLSYFDIQTIQSVCLRAGFAHVEWSADRRHYTLEHLYHRARTSPRTLLTRTICAAASLVPASWRRNFLLKLSTSGIVVTARRVQPRGRPLLSVLMPVYNERATFEQTLRSVLAKDCPGVDKEIVIVESHSTDGTRDLVRKYEGHPGVTVILQDRPRGKGAAVRAGLERATGTLVLIQDADSEYDVNDYDALLEPLLTFRRAFVLGSRHVGSWKVRTFNDQPGITAFFNLGHVLFDTALNVMYGQSIKDPFTMYKVFRRDCLHGLRLECNRFDFDFELVIKLVRKGYVPLEVPVNYNARSFDEGKKVSAFRDPITWIRALVKYRFVSIYDQRRDRTRSGA